MTNSSTTGGEAGTTRRRAVLFEALDDLDAINEMYHERRWTDGLPIIPPTEERVLRMLKHSRRSPDDVVAILAPAFGAATVERIAINAVMAGCPDALLPVLVAAVEAVAEKGFNLQAIQCTTHPAAVWIIVNGPVAQRLQINGTFNCLGQGTRANGALGRALRLILQNVGGALPAEMDRSTQGQPGKYSFCCAENEGDSPWEALHVERGFAPEASTVTVVAAGGTLNMNTHTKDGDELLRVIARSMAYPPSNDYWIAGEPWLALSPEHAEILKKSGYTKAEVKRRLWEGSKLAGREMAARDLVRINTARSAELGEIGPDSMIPISSSAETMGIIVAGGPGTHSVYVPCFGDSRAVTKQVVE